MAKTTSTQLACPTCGEQHNQIIDVRSRADETGLRRRRRCFACGHKWSTVEITFDEFRLFKERPLRVRRRIRQYLKTLDSMLLSSKSAP